MKKIAVLVIAVLLLMVFASGCTSNNNSTVNSSQVQNNSNIQYNSNITLQINSDSPWKGTLTYTNGTQIINGNGNATYNLGQNPGVIAVNLQKTDNAGTLSVQLIKNGDVVVNQITSGGQGIISINYDS